MRKKIKSAATITFHNTRRSRDRFRAACLIKNHADVLEGQFSVGVQRKCRLLHWSELGKKHIHRLPNVVTVTINDAPNMSRSGRRRIANWMRRQAGFIEQYHNRLSSRFTARYMYS